MTSNVVQATAKQYKIILTYTYVYVCDDDATLGLFFHYAQQANTGHHC